MQPIDYLPNYQNALQSIMGQVQNFQALSQNANTLKAQREQNRLATATNDRHIQAMNELNGLDFADETALRTWAGRYGDLEYGKGLKAHLDTLDEKAKKAEIGRVSQVYSLLKNGRGDLAVADLEQQATAYENAGDKANADGARQMARLITNDPKSALMQVGMSYAYMMPKDAMGNYKDFLQATAPNVQYQDMGGYGQVFKTDPITGEVTTQYMGDKTQSPDNYADNARALAVAEGGWDNAITVEGMRQDGAMERTQYTTQADLAKAQAQIDADMQKQQNQLAYNAQQERLKSGQLMTATDGYQMIYYPSENRAEYVIDPNGNRVKGQMTNNKHLKEIAELKASNDNSVGVLNGLQKALEMNNQIYSGALADERADFLGKFGLDTASSRKTQEYTNLIMNIAMRSMKEIFGGNPTEGERAALKELQASANKPPETRKVILENFMETIRNRVKSNNEQMAMYGGGQYQHKFKDSQPQQSTSYASMRLN